MSLFGKGYDRSKDLNKTSFVEELNKIQKAFDEWEEQWNNLGNQENPIEDHVKSNNEAPEHSNTSNPSI